MSDEISRFQLRLIDRRAALASGMLGVMGALGLLLSARMAVSSEMAASAAVPLERTMQPLVIEQGVEALDREHERQKALALEPERESLEESLLPPLQRDRTEDLRYWLVAASGAALMGCLLAAGRARGVMLVVTPSKIVAGRRERPTAWLGGFCLVDRTVLLGRDGTAWMLPPPPPGRVAALERALRSVIDPEASAYEEELSSAERSRQALGALLQGRQTERSSS